MGTEMGEHTNGIQQRAQKQTMSIWQYNTQQR